MDARVWQYILENKVASLLFIIVASILFILMLCWLIKSATEERRTRKTCKHEPECTKSKGICKYCLDYEKDKKGEK